MERGPLKRIPTVTTPTGSASKRVNSLANPRSGNPPAALPCNGGSLKLPRPPSHCIVTLAPVLTARLRSAGMVAGSGGDECRQNSGINGQE